MMHSCKQLTVQVTDRSDTNELSCLVNVNYRPYESNAKCGFSNDQRLSSL